MFDSVDNSTKMIPVEYRNSAALGISPLIKIGNSSISRSYS